MSKPSTDERPRILVVDDQPTNIQTLYQVLKGEYDVAMATDGSQAIELCLRRPKIGIARGRVLHTGLGLRGSLLFLLHGSAIVSSAGLCGRPMSGRRSSLPARKKHIGRWNFRSHSVRLKPCGRQPKKHHDFQVI